MVASGIPAPVKGKQTSTDNLMPHKGSVTPLRRGTAAGLKLEVVSLRIDPALVSMCVA